MREGLAADAANARDGNLSPPIAVVVRTRDGEVHGIASIRRCRPHAVLLILGLALLAAGGAAASEFANCTFRDEHGIAVNVRYEKAQGAYLRRSQVSMRNDSGQDLWLRELFPGQNSYWSLRARDGRIEPVAEDDFRPAPVPLSRDAPAPEATSAFRYARWKAGETVTETLDWDRFLLPGKRWERDERYVVTHDFGGGIKRRLEDEDRFPEMFSVHDLENACRLWMVKVVPSAAK